MLCLVCWLIYDPVQYSLFQPLLLSMFACKWVSGQFFKLQDLQYVQRFFNSEVVVSSADVVDDCARFDAG